jgi:hypothetical protein
MKLGTLTLILALAGIVANLFLRGRRDMAAALPAHPDFVDTEGLEGMGLEPNPAREAADSPNPAERLQAAGTSALGEAVEKTSDDLFGSNSQDGPYPRAPGLPDLTRGA